MSLVAIALGVSLVLPVSGATESSASASTTASVDGEAPAALTAVSSEIGSAQTPPSVLTDVEESPPPASPLPSSSEEEAGALLLSGRRIEALGAYRSLASDHPTPGIEAMVEVLQQKVDEQ